MEPLPYRQRILLDWLARNPITRRRYVRTQEANPTRAWLFIRRCQRAFIMRHVVLADETASR